MNNKLYESKVTRTQLTCQRCGYEWTPIVANPKSCPECKSREWEKPKEPKAKK